MRFLTVRAPWAYAMFEGESPKSIENRTWAPDLEQGRIGIHQAKRTDPAGFELLGRTLLADEQRDLGNVIGSVMLRSTHVAGSAACECEGNPWAFWPTDDTPRIVHWMIGEPRRLVTSFPSRGSLGLWEGTPSDTHRVETGEWTTWPPR